MECKYPRLLVHFLAKKELIETLWNVNKSQKDITTICYVELIETLWNVNTLATSENYLAMDGINRNIVECK